MVKTEKVSEENWLKNSGPNPQTFQFLIGGTKIGGPWPWGPNLGAPLSCGPSLIEIMDTGLIITSWCDWLGTIELLTVLSSYTCFHET